MRQKRIVVGPLVGVRGELIDVLRRVERGENVDYDELAFESYEAFRRVLTPERLRILQVIRSRSPRSIYELAKVLGRDRRSVIKDLKILELLGLVEFEEEMRGKRRSKRPVVSYDEIVVSISLHAPKN